MKLLRVMTAAAVVGWTGLALTAVQADNTTNPPPAHHGPRGDAQLEHILPPKSLTSLALTAEQKTSLESLEAAFQKDATKWRADNPVDEAAVKQARDTGDKEALRQFREKRQGLMDLRKGYLEKFRATLTDEQKTKLDTILEEMHNKQSRGQQHPKTPPATPPPAE